MRKEGRKGERERRRGGTEGGGGGRFVGEVSTGEGGRETHHVGETSQLSGGVFEKGRVGAVNESVCVYMHVHVCVYR